jgi:HEPN domain-containing protein
MATPAPNEARRFYRVAHQRFEDAEILLANNRTTGAMYLAGYAVECALKALLFANIPPSGHAKLLQSFSGKIGHDYEWLKRRLRTNGVAIPAEAARRLRFVSSWSTDLRYAAGRQDLKETRAFLDAAAQIVKWIERSF